MPLADFAARRTKWIHARRLGIEGHANGVTAFGGYDLWRLAQALDWVEPYDVGNAREILGSFMPGKAVITTVFENDTEHARRRLWHLLLEGDRGCIVWWCEDCIDWKSADYALTPKGKALVAKRVEGDDHAARATFSAERNANTIPSSSTIRSRAFRRIGCWNRRWMAVRRGCGGFSSATKPNTTGWRKFATAG